MKDTYVVPVRPDAAGPVAAEVEVGLYRLQSMAPLPVTDPAGLEVGRPIVGRVKVAVPTTASPTPENAIDADLDGRVRLVGYDLIPRRPRAGDTVSLTLHWQVTGRLAQDYTVFVHLLGSDDEIVGQADGPPMESAYPTLFWEPGETLLDTHDVTMPRETSQGELRLYVGLYEPDTWRRLPVVDARGRPQGDRILITRLRLGEE